MDEIKVSVCCVTYNHEKYLKEALDGILLQKTDFDYEVIISDDCSTDNSQEIIKSYIPKFGDRITAFLGEKNIGPCKNTQKVISHAKGRYIVFLETDDKWTDPYKLQKQADYLDNNPDVIAVSHRCRVIDSESQAINVVYPQCQKKEYTLSMFRKWILPGQTTTIMYRNYHIYGLGINSEFVDNVSKLGPGDRVKVFALMTKGKIHCLSDTMSDYRLVKKGGSSFSASNKMKYKDYIYYFRGYLKFAQDSNLPKEFLITSETLYIEAVLAAFILQRSITYKELKEYTKDMSDKVVPTIYAGQHILLTGFNKIKGLLLNREYI